MFAQQTEVMKNKSNWNGEKKSYNVIPLSDEINGCRMKVSF